MATYKNPWHKPLEPMYGPAFYTTDVKPTKYKDFQIFQRVRGAWDVVKDDICIGQRAGFNGAKSLIDDVIENKQDYFTQRALGYLST